jgi:hypothetical protein
VRQVGAQVFVDLGLRVGSLGVAHRQTPIGCGLQRSDIAAAATSAGPRVAV